MGSAPPPRSEASSVVSVCRCRLPELLVAVLTASWSSFISGASSFCRSAMRATSSSLSQQAKEVGGNLLSGLLHTPPLRP
eukprot:4144194-Prymnesium_polylepis.1